MKGTYTPQGGTEQSLRKAQGLKGVPHCGVLALNDQVRLCHQER